jgi:hypothetical protein
MGSELRAAVPIPSTRVLFPDLDQAKRVLIRVREGDDPFAFAQIERLVQTRDARTFEAQEPGIEVVDAKDRHEWAADSG